jgi:cystathionine beta-lyase/cystathionine gamma-synthase
LSSRLPAPGSRLPTGVELADWLDAASCPAERPPLDAMSSSTRDLHNAIDQHARRTGIPYLHPDEPTVQLDLLGSQQVIEWQEGKAAFLFASEGCWSELPHLYARYGTTATADLIAKLKVLEHASAALVCDSGMQATALAFDVLMEPGAHAVLMRQVYNKTRSYLEWLAARVGGSVTVVDDGDAAALSAAIRPETRFVFAETFTNPLVRAQDFDVLR